MKKLLLVFIFISKILLAQDAEDIEKVKKIYAPDKRTSIFEIIYKPETNVLLGKTNLPDAKKALLAKFQTLFPTDSIEILPYSNSTFQHKAIVNVSVANMRANPAESAELASQMLLGMPLTVFEKQRGWYRVQSPDHYIGWIDGSTMTQFTDEKLQEYLEEPKVIYTQNYGFAKNDTVDNAYPVRDLSFGNLLRIIKKGKNFTLVQFPDSVKGYVSSTDIESTESWLANTNQNGNKVAEGGFGFLGIPYLWGGTSFKGVDCSGFTRMTYLKQGILLPRDASQQALKGKLVNTDNDFENLLPGDLLFFGNTQTLRVSHVALWIGNKSFIHSSGMVRINNFDKNSPLFDEYNLNRLLFVKRIDADVMMLENKNLYKF
ncbi:glycoside hydrolase [Lacihabitans sp. LS3-19]|uniref:C40 family peptidase n=1 Tax=Lacihabitans sp. LS3-19 TaxID=2487335 RepID=UPI0020CC1862|nr:C40 family peptidase [Lacihabitans sp. LS3-19]MCP9769841.1 glycoside hydrolase [Lacihabitans sp. LS3-19]